ncbi:nucleoside recognition domain-containing protein [Prosthecobacter sp.]|uniref:nucleoside recognition domain-containing protein n=1 Tax=Prosthecobacter sp. TaxID=1965333 RepID=UPI002ABBFD26|nr:nucleoside recognition domain-containing protein [Prosthecobacter sp.]MDZ4406313.1 nucleoside recognition domain-containing protein [Prosthecobacter sp.]
MLNYIWAFLLLTGMCAAALLGNVSGDGGIVASILSKSKAAVMDIALPLAGLMIFWLGVMRVMEKAGLLELAARALSPIMRRLFPDVPRDHPAMSAMIMNLAANMLGLGNSATPLGLKAMTHLQELNPYKHTASNAMVTFLAMNTAAFTLVPMTAINYLNAAGVKGAHQIIVPTILATACTVVTAVVTAKLYGKLPMFAIQPDDSVESTAAADQTAPVSEKITPKRRFWLIALFVIFGACAVLEFMPATARESVLHATGLSQVVEKAKQKAAPAAKATPNSAAAEAPQIEPAWKRFMNGGSGLAIPIVLVITLGVGMAKGVKVYEEFVEGAKEGFAVATRIMPFLVAMLAALAVFNSSGMLLLLEYMLRPVLGFIGFPVELLPMALMRPLTGSGSLGVLNDILLRPESSDLLKYTAAIMYGSTETTFYVLAVYFGSVGIRRIRHALAAGLTADVVGMGMAVIIGRMLFS